MPLYIDPSINQQTALHLSIRQDFCLRHCLEQKHGLRGGKVDSNRREMQHDKPLRTAALDMFVGWASKSIPLRRLLCVGL